MGTTTDKLTYLQETKEAIKNAIIDKGVEVPQETTFREYATKINEISSSGNNDCVSVNLYLYEAYAEYDDGSQLITIHNYSGVISVKKNTMIITYNDPTATSTPQSRLRRTCSGAIVPIIASYSEFEISTDHYNGVECTLWYCFGDGSVDHDYQPGGIGGSGN